MKKVNIIIIVAIIGLTFSSCKNEKKESNLATTRDSLSYAFGVNIASSLKQDQLDTLVNTDLLINGFNDVISNSNPKMTSEQALKTLQNYFVALQKKEMEKSKSESEKFLAENAKKQGVKVLPSGLQYKIINEGKGAKPKANEKVKVNYTGKLIDGTVFDSSKEPAVFSLENEVIPGWQEGLQLMSVGSKYEFYIPYQLAYGERGYPGVIPPYAALIFEIELLGIEK
ncbi:MAG: FKBP-type peptidyl-prolyl cis-trans isomerase [Bacteroidales bacterium]|nr:FKBP-type peptidyl-prolyl cis-trans isomerase [Bacteroidales bacterium]